MTAARGQQMCSPKNLLDPPRLLKPMGSVPPAFLEGSRARLEPLEHNNRRSPARCGEAGQSLTCHPMLRNSTFGPEIKLPGRISAGSNRENLNIGPPLLRIESDRNPARKPHLRPRSTIV